MSPSQWQQFMPYMVAALVMAIIVRRGLNAKPRKVRLGALWIAPLLISATTFSVLATSPLPSLSVLSVFAAIGAAGLLVGHLRGRHLEITINGDTGEVTSKATPIGTMLIVGLFILRFGLKLYFPEFGSQPGRHSGSDASVWTDGALLFALGMVIANAATIWLRARPLVLAHRSGTLSGHET